MADPTDIRSFAFPTLAQPNVQDVLTAVDVLRNREPGGGRPRPFTAKDREKFQRGAVGGSRLERILAALDAFAQENPAAALAGMLPGAGGAVAGLGALNEGRLSGRKPGQLLRDLALAARGGRDLTRSQAQTIQRRAEREDRQANRELREGRGSGASPRRGDVSNAGR